jgi:uncharacterized protein
MFTRWIDLQKAKKSILLIGPRRSGKSTYLKHIFLNYKYVTLDDLDELELSKKDPKNWIDRLGQKFIIDEAQRNPEIAVAVKWAIDEKKIHCILTGSTGLNLFEKSTETLAGRIQIFYMTPACFGENFGPALSFEKIDNDLSLQKQAQRQLKLFLKSGGFPEILTAAEDEQNELLKIYKNSYFTRDVASINNIENVEGLRALYMALIVGLGSRYEVSSLVKETGLSTVTVKKYLNTLQQSGLLFKLYGYHQSSAKRYISSAKSYFIDVGILNSLSTDFSKGQLIESFVISEIEKRRRLGLIKADELYYYESVAGREIDLIYEEEKEITIIEIKSSLKVTARDLRNIREFKINTDKKIRKIIYYLGSEAYFENDLPSNLKIQIRPIWSLFRSTV